MIRKITTDDLRKMKNKEGLILQGCGGDLQEWQDGINDLLTKENILLDGSKFENCLSFEYNGIPYLENGDGTVIVINEESKLNGMEGNRRIEGDVLVGPIFIAGITEDSICSLTDEQMQKYAQKFAEPEEIPPEEIEQHTGIFFQNWY